MKEGTLLEMAYSEGKKCGKVIMEEMMSGSKNTVGLSTYITDTIISYNSETRERSMFKEGFKNSCTKDKVKKSLYQ